MIILSWMDWWKEKLPLTRGGSDKKKNGVRDGVKHLGHGKN